MQFIKRARGEGEKKRKRKTDVERQRDKGVERNRETEHTRRYITERKDEGDRGRKELSALCLGTGHLHRETLRKLFASRHCRFSLGLDDFLHGNKTGHVIFKRLTSSVTLFSGSMFERQWKLQLPISRQLNLCILIVISRNFYFWYRNKTHILFCH